jgi:hypothetical protein
VTKGQLKKAVMLFCVLFVLVPSFAFAGDGEETSRPAAAGHGSRDWKSGVGIGFSMSTLGFGGDVAVATSRKTNVRMGFNAFNFNHDFDKDGISYKGSLNLRSVHSTLDFFPFGGGFHLSPGVMLYNGNQLKADASVGSGNSFDLDGTTYYSSSADPIRGTGKLTLNKVAPMFLFGFGNFVPRSGRHVTFNFDAGVALQGSPDIKLNFTGSACESYNTNCVNAATDQTFLSHVAAEQARLTNDAKAFKYYPIIQFSIGYRFGGAK